MDGRSYLRTIPELASLLKGANHIDVKTVRSKKSLRDFLASMFNYQPGWVTFLYGVRSVLVRFLGLRKSGIPRPLKVKPEAIPFQTGANLSFFRVRLAKEENYIVAEVDDTHLKATLVIVVEQTEGQTRNFHVATVVNYHKWTGPVYFNLIRPFHHFVVQGMARAGS